MLLPLCVLFLYYCASVGGRNAQTLFEENFPFCWDADWLGTVNTIVKFGRCFFSVSALALLRKFKPNHTDDYPLIDVCIILSLASHVIYALSTVVSADFFRCANGPLKDPLSAGRYVGWSGCLSVHHVQAKKWQKMF